MSCCLALATGPAITAARIADHAREHAEEHAAHSHTNGDTPHHEHDPDGEPLPVGDLTAACTARLVNDGAFSVTLLPLEQVSIDPPVMDLPVASTSCLEMQQRFRGPPGPSPGHTLPLLI